VAARMQAVRLLPNLHPFSDRDLSMNSGIFMELCTKTYEQQSAGLPQ
jgi:hypothetical protein